MFLGQQKWFRIFSMLTFRKWTLIYQKNLTYIGITFALRKGHIPDGLEIRSINGQHCTIECSYHNVSNIVTIDVN